MISRECQNSFLAYLNQIVIAEERLDNYRELIWNVIITPSNYIEIFRIITANGKQDHEKWEMNIDDLKRIMEDFEVKFQWEELRPLMRYLSLKSTADSCTFEDFLYFILPHTEGSLSSTKKLSDKYRFQLEENKSFIHEGKNENSRNMLDSDNEFFFDPTSFELSYAENKSALSNIDFPKKLNNLRQFIYSPIKEIFYTEIRNIRDLQLYSRAVINNRDFSKFELFKIFDYEASGFVTLNNLRQFGIKLGRQFDILSLERIAHRLKVDEHSKIDYKSFFRLFFNNIEAFENIEKMKFNFYFRAIKGKTKPKSRRLVIRSNKTSKAQGDPYVLAIFSERIRSVSVNQGQRQMNSHSNARRAVSTMRRRPPRIIPKVGIAPVFLENPPKQLMPCSIHAKRIANAFKFIADYEMKIELLRKLIPLNTNLETQKFVFYIFGKADSIPTLKLLKVLNRILQMEMNIDELMILFRREFREEYKKVLYMLIN